MNTRVIAVGVLLFSVVGSLSILRLTRAAAGVALSKTVDRLGSVDFEVSRKAQVEILSAGKIALPALQGAIGDFKNTQQVALCYYLVGEIEPSAYGPLLLNALAPGKVCTVLQYPSFSAWRAMPVTERRELMKRFKALGSTRGAEEAACVSQAAASSGCSIHRY